MFASIRRCRMHRGSVDELAKRVDEGFAEEISAQPGFVSYEDMLEAGHVGAARKFASVRRYSLRDGSVAALMRKVDAAFR